MRNCCYIFKKNLLYNIDKIKKTIGKRNLIAVVKANAYGHGAKVIVKILENKVDYFAVASIEEAEEIRDIVGSTSILILGYTDKKEYTRVINNDLTLSMTSYKDAKVLNAIAEKSKIKIKCHIPIDTGMSRIGFLPNQIDEIEKICQLKNLDCQGIYSHFANADIKEYDLTKQTDLFEHTIIELANRGIKFKYIHIANSASILRKEFYGNTVRAGIILYGLNPSKEYQAIGYKKVMSWKAKVISVRIVKEGESVGYGSTYTATRDIKIATIAVGYADGLPFYLSNKGYVLFDGKKLSIVGRVCMDMTMINAEDVNLKVGDEVIIIGKSMNLSQNIEDILKGTDSMNYEFSCNIRNRVDRIII